MNRKLILSLAQIDVAWGRPDVNLSKAAEWIAEARRRGSDLIVFPELWTTGYDLANADKYASTIGQGTFERLAQLAGQHRIYISGSILRRQGNAIYNCAPLFSPNGNLLGDYDKIHLFRLMDEDRYLAPGQRTPVFDLPWGRCALSICYDLRFPELFRKYALAGAELILIPAEWPYPRLEHWCTLLRARAIENQCFIAACNRVGEGGGAQFFGRSAVIDPWGHCLVEAGEEEIMLTVSLDFQVIQDVRQRLTVFQDRRPDVYTL